MKTDKGAGRAMTEVVIVASAFGAEAVRRDGHERWLDVAAEAGASGFEVRRELFRDDAQASLASLARLGSEIGGRGLWCVYSTPAGLYDEVGNLDAAALAEAQAAADALGARFLKMQLGAFTGRAAVPTLTATIAGARARLLVENGQRPEDGTPRRFCAWFEALAGEGAAPLAGMTFDIGNWHWTGTAPVDAARMLGRHVEYIHCKAVRGSGTRRYPVAPAPEDGRFAEIFRSLPHAVPRGIEFPFDSVDLSGDARRRVAWLAHV
ncbi:Sugar phosphate isomerase/epimerase [Trinickia caryophylli]|uniref:Sugar phosphate isomerase/epimerase n=2 Tax=Trinickia caryophylli TaxID=28094 RepID=A0A1X7FY25_TRICW|nr:Sugar phosphate isomerase/epimerase [Trinickia caryophylli]